MARRVTGDSHYGDGRAFLGAPASRRHAREARDNVDAGETPALPGAAPTGSPYSGALISVVVTTFEAPAALRLSLRSLARQTDLGFDVTVADDGSSAETARMIAALREELPFALRHVRQENRGFRPGRARNLAVAGSRGDYLVFIDGDCFVLPDFVAWHRKLAQAGHFVSGKRSWLTRSESLRRLSGGPGGGRRRWFARALGLRCTRPLEFAPLPDGRWRHRKGGDWRGVQSCNLGVWRADFVAINGFDNRYEGHGLEDSDLAVRLLRSGVRRKLGSHSSPVLHLWHERAAGSQDSPNLPLFRELLRGGGRCAPPPG